MPETYRLRYINGKPPLYSGATITIDRCVRCDKPLANLQPTKEPGRLYQCDCSAVYEAPKELSHA